MVTGAPCHCVVCGWTVNWLRVAQGDKLHTAAKEAEFRRQRLEDLAAELAGATAAAATAEAAHREHMAALEPLRRHHRRSTVGIRLAFWYRSLHRDCCRAASTRPGSSCCAAESAVLHEVSLCDVPQIAAKTTAADSLRCRISSAFIGYESSSFPHSTKKYNPAEKLLVLPQMVAQKLETDLAVIQRKRAELEALEARYAKDLQNAHRVQEGDASQIADLEPLVAQDVREPHP